MSWMNITCRCGHTADINKFCSTSLFGQLPNGQYQCPHCGIAWKRQESDHRILSYGSASTLIPGQVEIITVESRL